MNAIQCTSPYFGHVQSVGSSSNVRPDVSNTVSCRNIRRNLLDGRDRRQMDGDFTSLSVLSSDGRTFAASVRCGPTGLLMVERNRLSSSNSDPEADAVGELMLDATLSTGNMGP